MESRLGGQRDDCVSGRAWTVAGWLSGKQMSPRGTGHVAVEEVYDGGVEHEAKNRPWHDVRR